MLMQLHDLMPVTREKHTPPHRLLLRRFLIQNWLAVGRYIVAALLSGLLKIVLLLLLGRGYELLSAGHSVRSAMIENFTGAQLPDGFAFALYFAGASLLFAIVFYFEKLGASCLGERFAMHVRNWVFAKHLRLPSENLNKNGFGRYLMRYGSDMTGLQRYVVRGWCRGFSDSILALGLLGAVFGLDLFAGVIILGIILAGMIALWLWHRLLVAKLQDRRRRQSRLIDFVGQQFESIGSIQRKNRFEKVEQRFATRNSRLYGAAISYHRMATPAMAVAETLPYFALAALLAGIAYQHSHPPLSVLVVLLALFPVIRRLSRLPAIWRVGMVSMQRLDALEKTSVLRAHTTQ